MPKKTEPVYKTESQLKEDARLLAEAEAAKAAAKPKSKTEKKLENFWYHYKWVSIACVFFIILAVVFINDTVLRERPDTTIIVVCAEYMEPERTTALAEAVSSLTTDFNGDKKTVIATDLMVMPSETEEAGVPQQDYAGQMKLVAVMSAATDPIYLLDDAAYGHITQMARSEDEPEDTDNIFLPKSIPADDFGFTGMRFYLRQGADGDSYYEYCKALFHQLGLL